MSTVYYLEGNYAVLSYAPMDLRLIKPPPYGT